MGKTSALGHPMPFLVPPFPTGEILPFPQVLSSAHGPVVPPQRGEPLDARQLITLLIVPHIFIYIDMILLPSP